MGTMRAPRKTSKGPGAELVDLPVPRPGEGEVLVRVHAASICGTDLHIYDWNEWAESRIRRVPMTFGHEVAGWSRMSVPRSITSNPGHSWPPRPTSPAGSVPRAGPVGPTSAGTSGSWGSTRTARSPSTSWSPPRTPGSSARGSTPTTPRSLIDPSAEDPVEVVLQRTDGNGAEVVLEMSGTARAIDQGTRMVARRGRMSLLGLPEGPVTLDLNDQVIFKEARVLGITGREMFRTWQQTTTLLSTGGVDVAPVITHRFPLERYEEAFATAASGQAAKVIMFAAA